MKKITAALLTAIITICAANVSFAAETWRDAFVTRLMKLLSQDPTYSEVVLTDLDSNGIPEAFVYRNSSDGGISAGFTMTGSAITSISVPNNIIGACLADITVYDKDGRTIFVGREIARNSSTICFYKLELSGDALTATRINKSDVSPYPVITYEDMYGNDFLSSGYPSRTKIQSFIDSYDKVNTVTASQSAAPIKVNGTTWDVSGYSVNNSNYYNIRDIAMILRNTGACFNVDWDSSLNAVAITTLTKYVIIGGELEGTLTNAQDIQENTAPIYVDGQLVELAAYNIDGSNYFQIRDLADIIGFTVDWDGESVLITTT
ncbi:MAG: copper amine oxidase N-terminal domain-containing protein [Firmicutes bacterium]|nr:copper amine oxidase N-terminal domain-containing protein [Bacillota bacterium]